MNLPESCLFLVGFLLIWELGLTHSVCLTGVINLVRYLGTQTTIILVVSINSALAVIVFAPSFLRGSARGKNEVTRVARPALCPQLRVKAKIK